jgi:hypothetical protein
MVRSTARTAAVVMLTAWVTVSCVSIPTITDRSELEQARAVVSRGEHAKIQVIADPSTNSRVPFDLAPDQQIEVTVAGKPTTITLANFYARCRPDNGPCDLDDAWIVVDHTREPKPDVVRYVVGGTFAAGLTVCMFACDRPWNYAAGGTLAGLALIALVVHLLDNVTLPIGR